MARATLALFAAAACQRAESPAAPMNNAVTPATHARFPISTGVHAVSCDSCHGDFTTFRQFTCLNCHSPGHDQALTDELHRSLVAPGGALPDGGKSYAYSSDSCLQCHATGARVAFDHAGVTAACASCHGTGAAFDPLPVAGTGRDGGSFMHPDKGGNDCRACHTIGNWNGAGIAPEGKSDPAQDLVVDAGIPSYAGNSITRVTVQSETLAMPMFHRSAAVPSGLSCITCHANANSGTFFPGRLHASLATQPATCLDCHATSVPTGFVGPAATSPPRTPASAEMKHDAVLWTGGAPTAKSAAPQECALCHAATPAPASWKTTKKFHASLMAALQPSSCLDCHANSRPSLLTSAGAALPANVQFDHSAGTALGECATCHVSGAAAQFTGWSGGRFHLPGSATPSTCLPCHQGERPTSVAGWDPSYTASPFDYVQDASGTPTHGAGQDCTTCHTGPGSGAWGGTQDWKRGHFAHGPSTMSATTCISCHTSQRPDRNGIAPAQIPYANLPFDHSVNGTGDCFGCHSGAAVNFVRYLPIPGDWQGGIGYPGDIPISSPDQFTAVSEITLTRSGPNNLFTGTSAASTTLYDAMVHTSQQVPATMRPSGSTDWPKCAMCHAVSAVDGSGTFAGGKFHAKVTAQGLPQPTLCLDCHTQMRPSHVVEGAKLALQYTGAGTAATVSITGAAALTTACTGAAADNLNLDLNQYATLPDLVAAINAFNGGGKYVASVVAGADPSFAPANLGPANAASIKASPQKLASELQPMDHQAALSTGSVAQMDCATCHAHPGTTWVDGAFHANIGTAQPQDCTVCHYPVMADAAKADLTSGVSFTMRHKSGQLTFQNCETCHGAKPAVTPIAAARWNTGAFHASVGAQPLACNECHSVSEPAAGASTQSGVRYNLPLGGTATNAAQWMNHGSPSVVGKDCAACHTADAATPSSAWKSPSDFFHGSVQNPAGCQECHGLTNGGGAGAGTNNNLPLGLTNSSTVTSAASDNTTGIPAGTLDQITHEDLNVSSHDCTFCHTQKGVSTAAGVQGKEWAQASFHASFNAGKPLVMNGTTGRCSDCHLNVKPTAGFPLFDHSGFTSAPGSQDCSSCHIWPGTGTASAPNWLGASAAPLTVTLPGWSSGSVITSETVTFSHPAPTSYTSCAQCHLAGSDNKTIIDFNHDGLDSNVTINGVTVSPAPNLGTSQYNASTNPTFCVACHNSRSPFVNNAGLTSTLTANTSSGSTIVSTGSTSALTLGMTVSGQGIPSTTTTTSSFTGTITTGSTTVTTASAVSLRAGTVISGTGIPANDTVAASVNNATSFTLTAAATASATETLTATATNPLTVNITSIPSSTSFVVSSPANATLSGTSLTVTHRQIEQVSIGSHGGSNSSEDCTSCHYVGGNQHLTPPTPGVFATGSINGN